MTFELARVAKLAPSKMAVYATARPYGVDRECEEIIVSKDESAPDVGKRARIAATPAVTF